ncbi:Retrovirus-related Pol polyprotein from transposon TNT 1-94 [Dendrobium catenatum]|uniref:Retrovirus-related Pol polyprotein from transposon TNT 1-94 n=1 Tax=Dendrobium catenatum TaxID=906689 RepID=A0A2I0VMZ0_9ASPA|nr:Retrovirus-related Pol polyprotein from transposon TNT 1-94 [Dendrobium catenatum]
MTDSASSCLQDRSDNLASDEATVSANLKFVVSNLRNLVSSSLTPDNFLIWKSQILKTLRANGFLKFLDSKFLPPSQFVQTQDGTSAINPAYAQWIQTDQNLSASICSTIFDSILPYVIYLESTAEVWSALETRFQATNRSKVIQLRNSLHNVSLKNNSMTVYLSEIKAIVDQIAAAGSSVDPEDIIHHILNGLPPMYQSFKSSIRTSALPLTLDQIYPLLLSEEINLAADAVRFSSNQDPTMELFNTRGRGRRPKGKASYNPSTSNNVNNFQPPTTTSIPRNNSAPAVLCQICFKKGHSAQTCWHRLNIQYVPSVKNTNSALVASSDAPDTTWFLDSEASSHLTNSMDNMSIAQSYHGDDNITVGNGHTVPISHTGSGILPTPNRSCDAANFTHRTV